jgi:hypothetical protein
MTARAVGFLSLGYEAAYNLTDRGLDEWSMERDLQKEFWHNRAGGYDVGICSD